MKDEYGEKIDKYFVILRPEMYNYLKKKDLVDKKAKGRMKNIIK